MREIKLRAWIEKDVPDLWDGAEWKMKRHCAMKDVKSIHFGTGKIMVSDAHGNHSENPDNYKLMQYTGLKDINGVEIYEGDIVEVFSDGEFAFNHQVAWSDEHGCYCIDAIHGCNYDYTTMPWAELDQYYSYKVIGNIHQNPELLELAHA